MDTNVFINLVIFPIVFIIAATIIGILVRRNSQKSQPAVTQLAIPANASGYLVGKTVFSKSYLILADELIYIDGDTGSASTRIKYEDVNKVTLRGWFFLSLELQTKQGARLRVIPINRVRTIETSDPAHPVSIAVENDTAGRYYMRTQALLRHAEKALYEKGITAQLKRSDWTLAIFRLTISAIVITALIIIVTLAIVLETQGAKIVLPF